MRILFIHSDYLEYEVKTKATEHAEKIAEKEKLRKVNETLTAFISVEREDEGKEEKVIKKANDEIVEVAKKLKSNTIVLYPYAHLSASLSNAETALKILKGLETALLQHGYSVVRAPFGWYKAFTLKCKGHPLSELSKQIVVEEEKVTREEIVKKVESSYVILTPEGREIALSLDAKNLPPELDNYPLLKQYILAEEIKCVPTKMPPSIKTMQRLELVDYEPASDCGHFRLYPKGYLIFTLMERWAHHIAVERLGAMQIDTPILYDWAEPDIRAQGLSFHERHYMVDSPDERKKFVLRFAGDFGLFRMMKDANLSYKQLPVRIYEFSKSFRYEKRGELTGLKRLRAFHMPDLHYFTVDIESGWTEYKQLYEAYTDLANGTGVEYVVAFRVVKEFYEKYKQHFIAMLRYSKTPALIELLSERKHYWVVKHELNGMDSVGGACQLGTVQLDVEDAERYGIVYVDKDGKKRGCIIGHSSIGSIERWLYCLLETALKKPKPTLPFWLSPTQVRLVPTAENFIQNCEMLAAELRKFSRVDIDDREENVARKIRDAEREWIPIIVVYGEKERAGEKLAVRLRGEGIQYLTIEQLKEKIKAEQGIYPWEQLSLPVRLSKRIVFRG